MNKIFPFYHSLATRRMACVFFVLLLFTTCKEESPSGYTGKEALYFDTNNGKRELFHTFFLVPQSKTTDTVFLRVNTMGQLADHNRSIPIRQTNSNDKNAAKPNVHYLALDDPEMKKRLVVQANSSYSVIPIVLLRHPDMEREEFRLEIEVFENEYFESIPAAAYTKFIIRTTAVAVKPSQWDVVWMRFFGDWGSVKMKFIMDATGFTDWEKGSNDIQFKTYLATKCKSALHKYNTENPGKPLRESDGTIVVFP